MPMFPSGMGHLDLRDNGVLPVYGSITGQPPDIKVGVPFSWSPTVTGVGYPDLTWGPEGTPPGVTWTKATNTLAGTYG